MEETDTPTLQRVSELWFNDATAIFQAGNYLFRVYPGLLAARSSVFRDMFSIPQPNGIEDSPDDVEGCAVIRLPDDGEEVKNFFFAIYDSCFFERHPYPAPLQIIAGIVRLSHKYDSQPLLRLASSHLKYLACFTLEDFDKKDGSPTDSPAFDTILDMIALATKVGMTWILPCLYYSSCNYPISVVQDSESWEQPDKNSILQKIVFGKLKLVALDGRLRQVIHHLRPDNGCEKARQCQEVDNIFSHTGCLEGRNPEFGAPQHALRVSWYHFCSNCSGVKKEVFKAHREKYWTDLPAAFGLPSWAKLRELKDQESSKAL